MGDEEFDVKENNDQEIEFEVLPVSRKLNMTYIYIS